MNRNLVAVFVVIVVAPLVAIGWMSARLARQERARVEDSRHELMRSTLRNVDAEIRALLERRESEVRTELAGVSLEPEDLRRLAARLPLVRQAFVVDARRGVLVYPSLLDTLSRDEEDFLRRTREIWTGQQLQPQHGGGEGGLPEALADSGDGGRRTGGWYAWFWGDGLHLLLWWKHDERRIVGVEVDRAALLADVVAALPDTDPLEPELGAGRIRLLDARGDALCQWGAREPAAGEWPRERQALSPPLAAWTLEYFAGDGAAAGLAPALLPWLSVLLVVAGLAVYFFRESSREIREAGRKVSFVNQVSHELKTPLTNIRLYAELLDDELGDEPANARDYLAVIVTESQRLSRLILNILTFNRKQRHDLTLRFAPGVVDDAVAGVLDQFRPSFGLHGLEIAFRPGAPRTARFDADAVHQIVGNLLSNVEKYAAGSGPVEIVTGQNADEITILVADRGPGIPDRERGRVFEPFYRVSNSLSDGVTGAGIGLSLVRDLARLHGGDVEILNADVGAAFRVALRCPSDGEARA